MPSSQSSETNPKAKWRDLALLFALALAARLLSALPLRVPGYMDAYYYYIGAERIVQGYGLSEPFLWNYLGEPLSLPAPAFQFWLPLTSFIMVPSLALLGSSFRAGQLPFVLLASLLPLIAYETSRLLAPSRRRAWLAGLLTLSAPFYVKYWVSTDNFTPFAVTGSLALLALARGLGRPRPAWLALAGGLIGLSHLTRADAPLLFAVMLVAGLWPGEGAPPWRERRRRLLVGFALAGLAYLAVMGPWFWRNLHLNETLLGPAGLQALFLRSYDDLFSYGRPLTLQSYLEWGWPAILRSKLDAAASNLTTVIVVLLSIFLAPLAGVELWARRRELLSRLTGLYLLLLYLTMTLLFTFPGPRGSLLHSGGALLPALTAFAAAGLERSLAWAARRRAGWDAQQASRVFAGGLVALSIGMGAFIYVRAVWAGGDATRAWNTHDDAYRAVGAWLDARGAPADLPVMVVNPPAFYYFARRPALAIPNEPPDVVAQVCRRFGAGYLLLERDRPAPLDAFFRDLQREATLRPVAEWSDPFSGAKLYRCLP